jgi:hypothetical protein
MDVVGNKPVEVLAALALRLAIVFFGCIVLAWWKLFAKFIYLKVQSKLKMSHVLIDSP